MQCLIRLQNIALLVLLLAPFAALGDNEIRFVYEACLRGMATQPSVSKSDSEALCSCSSIEVKKKITEKQRASIREANNLVRMGRSIPPDIFQKSGLKTLVENSQEHCIKSVWPKPQRISDREHEKYSAMANKSVDEFNDMLEVRCGKYPKSDRRTKCLTDASKEWLATKGKHYSNIPDVYITGNDLANSFIQDAR